MLKKISYQKPDCGFKGGFTLVELVVVVAILGILAAAAVVLVTNISQKARESKLKSVLATLREAINLQRSRNLLDNATLDNFPTPNSRSNFYPTIQELSACRDESASDFQYCILQNQMPQNPLKELSSCIFNPSEPADQTCRNRICSACDGGAHSCYSNSTPCRSKGYVCDEWNGNPPGIGICPTGWYYNPRTGEFWANSNYVGENNW